MMPAPISISSPTTGTAPSTSLPPSTTSNLPFPTSFPLPPQPPSPTTLHALTIISSSKINSKVTQILSLLYPTPPPASTTTTADKGAVQTEKHNTDGQNQNQQQQQQQQQQPLVAITAKPAVANKLISVVEIIKRDVRESPVASGKALFQYTAIKGVVEASKPKRAVPQKNKTEGSKKRPRDEDQDGGREGAGKRVKMTEGAGENVEEDEGRSDAESEDAFVTQATPVFQVEKPKRDVPYLTIYLSPVHIKELREAYGEEQVFSRARV